MKRLAPIVVTGLTIACATPEPERVPDPAKAAKEAKIREHDRAWTTNPAPQKALQDQAALLKILGEDDKSERPEVPATPTGPSGMEDLDALLDAAHAEALEKRVEEKQLRGSTTLEGIDSADPSFASPDTVKRGLLRYVGQLNYCYEKRLKDQPELKGKLELRFVVTMGRATSVTAANNSTEDPELAKCAVSKAKRWRFPEEAEGEFVARIGHDSVWK